MVSVGFTVGWNGGILKKERAEINVWETVKDARLEALSLQYGCLLR